MDFNPAKETLAGLKFKSAESPAENPKVWITELKFKKSKKSKKCTKTHENPRKIQKCVFPDVCKEQRDKSNIHSPLSVTGDRDSGLLSSIML